MPNVRREVSGVKASGVRCQVARVRNQVSGVRFLLKALGRLLGASETVFGWSWGLLRALERLLGGSWEALGRLLEASKRHLGPKTVIASIFGRFKEKSEILGVHLGDLLTSKIVFFRVQRGYPT